MKTSLITILLSFSIIFTLTFTEDSNFNKDALQVQKITPDFGTRYSIAKWSPNGKYVAFTLTLGELWYVDLETMKYRKIKGTKFVNDFIWKNNSNIIVSQYY